MATRRLAEFSVKHSKADSPERMGNRGAKDRASGIEPRKGDIETQDRRTEVGRQGIEP